MENERIAIFGGTGSLGTVLAKGFLRQNGEREILLISNNEQELWEVRNLFHDYKNVKVHFLDIRDKESIEQSLIKYHPEIIINCAALKHVGFCEDFPMEAIKTNIMGLNNLLEACSFSAVDRFLQISTDKAVEPIGIMGATKFIGERLVLNYNKMSCLWPRFSCIRMGNVLNSRGSLIPQLQYDLDILGYVKITDMRMERFFISQKEVWDFMIHVLDNMEGGEIFIPKLTSKKVINIINSFLKMVEAYNIKVKVTGRKKGEKLQEKLFSEYENIEECEHYWKITENKQP